MEIKKFGSQVVNNKLNQEVNSNNPVKPNELQSEIIEMITERLGDEYSAYYFYVNAANWCKNVNYKKASAFFESEASSELEHAKGLQDYLTQWNIIPQIPQVNTVYNFINLVDIINKAYSIEFDLLQKYSENQKELFGQHPATHNFIQKYVDLQNDAVSEFSDLLNAAVLVNTNDKFQTLYFEQTYF